MTQFKTALSVLDLPAGFKKSPEMPLNIFEEMRGFIYSICGIYFPDNKKYLLESRLARRINYLGMSGYSSYLDYIKYNDGGSEKIYLYEAVTFKESFFFRNQPQLDALVSTVIPEIAGQKLQTGKNRIRIWSAASPSGEEAYSIAITIVDMVLQEFPGFEFEIAGTCLSSSAIETAKRGVYKEYSVQNTPQHYLKKYFKRADERFEVDPAVKKMVSFKNLNLYDELSIKAMSSFDIIFCTNVLNYFDHKSRIKVVSSLYNSLNRGGYLFIGSSDTLRNISGSFKLASFPKTSGYKKE